MVETKDASHVGAALLAFFVGSFGWMLTVGVITAVAAFATNPDLDPARVETMLTPPILGLSATLQAGGLGVIALLLTRWLGPWPLQLGHVRGLWLAAAGIIGLFVGLGPSWLASVLAQYLPASGLEVLAKALQDGDPAGTALLALGICVAAPIGEEIAFRHYLWHHLERRLPGAAVWIATSLLFAAYHLDPVQAPALVPTALVFGWLRYVSGSVWPCILCHFVNNAFAFGAMVGLYPLPTSSPVVAAAGTMITIAVCGASWWIAKRTP